ncbi:MAG: sulfurtransferase [Betaproteobacteria bacterium]|nr:MAG: sulfurtransferase [Betaproteobacteria bacterium]
MYTTLISTDELAERLSDPSLALFDVRHDLMQPERWGADEYRKAHIPSATFLHIDSDLSGPKNGVNGRHPLPTPETAAALFSRVGIDGTKQVVAYDQNNGVFASRLWWMLRWLGHESVAVVDGGFAKWMREGRAVTSEATEPTATTFVVKNVAPTVNSVGVESSLSRHTLLLVDARAPERFRGEVEPMDPVAGHIPGAVNRPASLNVTASGVFKPANALRSEYQALLGGRPHSDVVHYCGSGVTACHNILAMQIAGLPATRLYPGSWSEWISNPDRPVARASAKATGSSRSRTG